MASSEMLRRVALVRTEVSEELTASIIRVTRIGELGITLAVTRNRRTLPTARHYPETFFFIFLWYSFLLEAEYTPGPSAVGRIR
jgi:hypothetical protein